MNRKVYIAVTAALASMLLWSCGESDNKTAKKNATQNVTEAQTMYANLDIPLVFSYIGT